MPEHSSLQRTQNFQTFRNYFVPQQLITIPGYATVAESLTTAEVWLVECFTLGLVLIPDYLVPTFNDPQLNFSRFFDFVTVTLTKETLELINDYTNMLMYTIPTKNNRHAIGR